MTAPYSRVYWSVMDDPKFDGIRENVAHLGTWTLLLLVAEMAYPAPAMLPRCVPDESVAALVSKELVDVLSGDRYSIRGLAAEREKRSQWGRNAAALRWQSERSADPMQAKQSKAEHSKETTPSPLRGGTRKDGTSPRQLGENPRAHGTSPRQEREAEKRSTAIPQNVHDILQAIQTKGKP